MRINLSNNNIRSLKYIDDISNLEELNFLALDLSGNKKVTNKEPYWSRNQYKDYKNSNEEEEKVEKEIEEEVDSE